MRGYRVNLILMNSLIMTRNFTTLHSEYTLRPRLQRHGHFYLGIYNFPNKKSIQIQGKGSHFDILMALSHFEMLRPWERHTRGNGTKLLQKSEYTPRACRHC